MGNIRSISRRRFVWALIAIALALASRAIVPTGFMPQTVGRTIMLTLCSGHGPLAMRLDDSRGHGAPAPAGKAHDSPCGFGFAGVSIGGADPVLLLIAVIAAMALASAPSLCPPPRPLRRLRPPLRGPPLAPPHANFPT